MGLVIGRNGTSIKQIQTESGAKLDSDRNQRGFWVRGNEEQRARKGTCPTKSGVYVIFVSQEHGTFGYFKRSSLLTLINGQVRLKWIKMTK